MKTFTTLIFALALSGAALAVNLSRVYLDKAHNVHLVTAEGSDRRLTATGHRAKPLLSADDEIVAWVVIHPWIAPGDTQPGASELQVFRQGRTRSIKCEPFIRDFWFLQKGKKIAIDCGGSHFAGREILYDIYSLKEIESFSQATVPTEKRPSWSISSDQFNPD